MARTPTLPGMAILANASSDGTIRDLCMAVMKIVLFVMIGFILYSRAVGLNEPQVDPSDDWTWNFVDCL